MKPNKLMRVLELEELIEEANVYYNETGEDYILESEYNNLMQELKELDPNNIIIQVASQPIVNSQGKIIHEKAMLSLDKVYSIDDLKKWMIKISRTPDEIFDVMIKYDGIAGRFKNGTLSTRGDGSEGENISHRMNLIEFYDEEYDGELLITDDTFKEIVEKSLITRGDGEPFKNSRNAVSGILRSEQEIIWNPVLPKPIQFIPYNWFSIVSNIESIEQAIAEAKEKYNGYPRDGIVVKIADEEYAESLGVTSHHPKHSMALKEDTDTAITKLLDVEFQVAKEYIGMVGLLTPVELGGVTISRVSLHNMDFVKSLNLKIGDDIRIKRAGEVIPQVIENLGGGTEDIICETCPSCGSDVILDGQFWKCLGDSCPDKEINKILASCRDLGIKGVAESSIRKLYETGLVSDVSDLLVVTGAQLVEAGWKKGSKSLNNILKEMKRVKTKPIKLTKVLGALNIPGFGVSLFEKILNEISFTDLEKLLVTQTSEDAILALEQIPNMSTVRAQQLVEAWFPDDLVRKLVSNLVIEDRSDSSAPLNEIEGEPMQTICFTGKMPEVRSILEGYASKCGYNPVSKVNKDLDILVVEDPTKNSKKQQAAVKFGSKIISRTDFYRMVGREV